MSDMPPKKKRPRVAGQPRPGSRQAEAGSTASSPTSSTRPVAGTSRRAPITRLGSSTASPSAKPVKSAPGKVPLNKRPAGKASSASALPGEGRAGGGTVAKTAPRRAGANAGVGRGPLRLAGVGLLGLLIGLFGLWHPGGASNSDQAFINTEATTEVLGQMEHAACAILGPTRQNKNSVEDWIKYSRSVLVGPARADWEKQMPTNREVIEQTQQTQNCRIDAIGVRALTGTRDGSTAQVIASQTISLDQAGRMAGSLVVGMQYHVVRQDGKWKIERVDAW